MRARLREGTTLIPGKVRFGYGLSGSATSRYEFIPVHGNTVTIGWERYGYATETTAVRMHTQMLVGLGFEERVFYMSPTKRDCSWRGVLPTPHEIHTLRFDIGLTSKSVSSSTDHLFLLMSERFWSDRRLLEDSLP
jgi:hypothetical protein